MTATWSGRAPGKLILCGEHAVVHGHPAIALAVDRGTCVRLVARPGPSAVDAAPFADPRLWPALRPLLPAEGLGLHIASDLPVGRGMGSSAALAVALVRALAAREGREATIEACIRDGFAIERHFHGNPSGVDHTVSARGGALLYRRVEGVPAFSALPAPPLRLVVLDSGAAGDTAAQVAAVAARLPGAAPLLEMIGALVEEVAELLAAPAPDPGEVGNLLSANHDLLCSLGVSTPRLDALVDLALETGAHGAKLAGAGGGGVVLALVDEPGELLAAARDRGIDAFSVAVAPPTPGSP
jgi:mevalonate kinase